jgi:hypothetical protein
MTYNTDSDCSQIKIWKIWRYKEAVNRRKTDNTINDTWLKPRVLKILDKLISILNSDKTYFQNIFTLLSKGKIYCYHA